MRRGKFGAPYCAERKKCAVSAPAFLSRRAAATLCKVAHTMIYIFMRRVLLVAHEVFGG
jgi:hypothetical protein